VVSLVALYRGATVASAKLVSVTSDPSLVARVAHVLLSHEPTSPDPIVDAMSSGRREALRLVREEAEGIE
jgi:hypothetical protein